MSEDLWFVRDKERVRGPFSHEQLLKLHQRGQLARFHDISTDRKDWVKAATLLDPIPQGPPPADPQPSDTWPAPSQEVPMTQPSSSDQWPRTAEDGLIGDRRRPKSSRWRWLIAIAFPCIFLASGLLVLALRGPGILPAPFTQGGAIQSLDDEKVVSRAVGLVVVGVEQKMPDGTHGEIPVSTGTCFAVSADGVFVTNRHVVEFHDQMVNAEGIEQRKIAFYKKFLEDQPDSRAAIEHEVQKFPPETRDERREELIWNRAEHALQYSTFDPKIWVFLMGKNGQPIKCVAQIEELCAPTKFDIAILKVRRPAGEPARLPFFRVSNSEKEPRRGERVVALGFPGTSRETVSVEEKLEDRLRKARATQIDSYFKDRDFDYVRMPGEVTQIFSDKASGCRWIQHNAVIAHGNSGGPLLSLEGFVVGVNTWGLNEGATFRAIAAPQLRATIEKYAPAAVFVP